MEYKLENRVCQNCHKDFTIEPDDFSFYEKIKVPAPTFCPECRLKRRLIWMPGITLFKRPCDLCGKEVFSMYERYTSYKIYCNSCWWSDRWNSLDYGIEYDFSKPFFEQWKKLLANTPILGLHVDKTTNETSPYVNHIAHSKNCYLLYFSDINEDCMFGFWFTRNKHVFNSSFSTDCELCFDNNNSFKNYDVLGSKTIRNCVGCRFLKDCINCQNCFGCIGLVNKNYCFFNEQLSREDYKNKIKDIDLASFKSYQEQRLKSENIWNNNIPKPEWSDFSENCTGSFVYQSKNCKECYEVVHSRDSKFLMLIKERTVVNSYDYTDWGLNAELVYEGVTVGENVSNIKFCHETGWGSNNLEYCKLMTGSHDCFGCISLKNKEYCIFNKQYTKEEYFKMVEKIKNHMNDIPYIDKVGNIYKYGEFFPMEFSPHAYNNSFSNFLFPKSKKEIELENLKWFVCENKEYNITLDYKDLEDNINEVTDDILKEIIQCSNCVRGYRIIKPELDFYKKMHVPLPRQCPFCRVSDKVNEWTLNMKLYQRTCSKCGKDFKTHYPKEKITTIYCKDCYKQEVY